MVNSESYNMDLVNIEIIFFLIIVNNKSKRYICCNTKRY